MKIEMADMNFTKKYFVQIEQILSLLDEIEEGWSDSLLTDKSSVADFMLAEADHKYLEEKLGFEIDSDDLFIDLAVRLKKKAEDEKVDEHSKAKAAEDRKNRNK